MRDIFVMMSEVQTNKECLPELNNPKIICEKCQLSFTRKSNFYRHMRRIHHKEEEDLNINRGKICGICNKKLGTLSLLHAHITEKHGVSLKFTEETFYCEDDFLKWKSEIERGQSNFNLCGLRDSSTEGVKVRCYVCHRSGLPNAERKKQQHSQSKRSWSMKIGFTCPASIYVVSETVEDISCIKVKYQSVHVGHELGVKLRISKEDKARLASSMNAGVSISTLLKELRENYDSSHPYRQITRKDLHNISKSFNISRACSLQPDDFLTVDNVVKEIFNSRFQSALLVYKPVGETLPEYTELNINDFLLGIMNDVQEKLLEMYGNRCIMVDYTDFKNFYLTTLMVQDANNESVPVATFFSSKTSVEVLQPFFDAIQLRLPDFKTKIIMSDDVISFYNAWQKVFGDGAQHLLCSWFVLRNLIRNVEIKANIENRTDMKIQIKNFLKEEDIATFELMMKTFIEEYENEEKDFMTYFQTHYAPRAKKWAYCYRIALGMNPDLRLERWRNQLKMEEKGSVSKRLDKTLTLVNSAIAKKLISNAIVMDMDKLSARILLCERLHEESLSKGDEYKVIEVSEKKCTISESENKKTCYFTVEKLREVCLCDIRCGTCNICIHSMSCTCVDYCVHFAICKHMHRFCRSFAPASKITTIQESEDSFSFCDNEPTFPMEIDYVRDEKTMEPNNNPQFIIYDVKARIKTQLQNLEKRMEDINFLEILKNVEEKVNSINSYLDDAIPSCSFSNKIPTV